MTSLVSGDPGLYNFWLQEGESLANDLFEYCRALSTKIPSISKDPFFLYLNWRELTGSDWITIRIALHFLEDSKLGIGLTAKSTLGWVVRELKDGLARSQRRMSRTKFSEFELWLAYDATPEGLGRANQAIVPKAREWLGNYTGKLKKILGRIFSLRFNTPKRVQRQRRVRGYRDHGSMATVDEKARRSANTSGWNSQLEGILRYIQETGSDIPSALRIFDMQSRE
jgi:hypothetical protein